jgi:hypothetical protein
LLAGEQATLAVIDAQGRLMPNVAVELTGGQNVKTDATGRAYFTAGGEPGTLSARIADQNQKITSSATVLAGKATAAPATSTAPQGADPAAAKVTSYPRFLTIHDRFSLEGAGFRGTADSNHVYLNGEACLVVASSPVSLVALPGPRVPIGDVNLRVSSGGMDAGQFQVSAVLLEISGPSEAVTAGSEGELTVHARGTSESLQIEVRNSSPAVIQLAKGNVQRVRTSGGEENVAPVSVKFLADGNYVVSARLVAEQKR